MNGVNDHQNGPRNHKNKIADEMLANEINKKNIRFQIKLKKPNHIP